MNTCQAYPKMALNYQQQLKQLSPGYRFDPSDQELIGYLKRRAEGVRSDVIPEAKIYDAEPFNLDGIKTDDGESKYLYFLTKTKKRFPGRNRVDRRAGNGYWNVRDMETSIKDSQGIIVGSKRYLSYRSRDPSLRNQKNWNMHEHTLTQQSSGDEEWVLCKITRGKLISNSGRDTIEINDVGKAEDGDDGPKEVVDLEGETSDNNRSFPTDRDHSTQDLYPDILMNDGSSYQTAPADTAGNIDCYGNSPYWMPSPLQLQPQPPSSGPYMDSYSEEWLPAPPESMHWCHPPGGNFETDMDSLLQYLNSKNGN